MYYASQCSQQSLSKPCKCCKRDNYTTAACPFTQGISAPSVTWTAYKSLVCLFRDFPRTDGSACEADMKGKATL